jgi:hypothetical protein
MADDDESRRRHNLDDDVTQPYNQQTAPVPALKKPRSEPTAPPPPPQILLQTRPVVDDDNDDEAAWEKKYTWANPDPYSKEERENHPLERGDWLPFGEQWIIAAASARGLEHRNGKYRDDDYAIRVFAQPGKGKSFFRQGPVMPYAAIIAIADGLGSKPLSRHGARAASQGAISVDTRLVYRMYERLQAPDRNGEMQRLANETFNAAFNAAAERVTEQAKQDEVTVEDLHSTLILVLAILDPHDPDRLTVIASQVGDGSVYTVQRVPTVAADTNTSDIPDAAHNTGSGSPGTPAPWRWLLKPQVEPTGTQVTPFMVRYKADPERLLTEMKGQKQIPLRSLLAMTDGPAEVLTPYAPTGGADVFQHARPFFEDVSVILRDTNDEKAVETRGTVFEKKAKELLQRKLRVGDDVTLVCLFHRDLLNPK